MSSPWFRWAYTYWNWDTEASLTAEREAKDAELAAIQDNDRNARGLSRDLEQVRSLYDRIKTKALDFDSTIVTQAFFAELVQMPGVKTGGLSPVPQSAPVFTETKPFAVTDYAVRATAGFHPLAAFVSSIDTNPTRSMVLSRVQIQTSNTGAGASGSAAKYAELQPGQDVTRPSLALGCEGLD